MISYQSTYMFLTSEVYTDLNKHIFITLLIAGIYCHGQLLKALCMVDVFTQP